MNTLISWAIIAGVIVVALLIIGFILTRLYTRASKEVSFVRTGMGGESVILNGGAFVLPVLHEVIPVNMNTLRLEVRRADNEALITKDRMRVDVKAEFYVRVRPLKESIATAAQTLGMKTMAPGELKELVEGKFVDALRAVAAEMDMEELHEKRVDFVQRVQRAVSEDLAKNGLELETVSLTGLDQTRFEYFNPQNAFDAEGLTRLTQTIEERRKLRNDIEQETDLAIRTKNLEAERSRIDIVREEEYAKLEQEREISIRRAEQMSNIATEESMKQRIAEEAKIAAQREIDMQRINAERDTRNQDIIKEQALEQANIERQKALELAEQERQIAVAEKSRAESVAKAEADKARALAVQQAENVITVREREIAERAKAVQLIKATEEAEKDAIDIKVAAQAEKQAATDRAEAVRIEAQGQADKKRLTAQGEADAQLLIAQAQAEQYRVEAEGQEAINTAANMLSPDQIDMQIRMALLERLPAIIAESVKPIENIDGIKILQIGGNGAGMLGQGNGNGASYESGNGGAKGSLADDMVNSALRYRSQAPLIDHLLGELGLAGGGDINALTGALVDSQFSPVGNKGASKRAQARQSANNTNTDSAVTSGDAGASIHSLELPDHVSKRVNKAIDKAEESTEATVNHIKYQQPAQQSNAPQPGPTTRTMIQPAHKRDE
ncbi:flotillin family protein [Psychrobacter arenosus]|uniref:flotillin family protein n=1 Tax=Psychrobacter arenosus TaxID=256326 RepID=UPI00191A474B|nr:flotillin family protein [Psychrobacter arenosus]